MSAVLKAKLYIRVRLDNGRRVHVDPVFAENQKLKPLFALINGKPEKHNEGVYYLRYLKDGKYTWEAAGADSQEAVRKLNQKNVSFEAQANGLKVVADDQAGERRHVSNRQTRDNGIRTSEATTTYLIDTEKYKSEKTYTAYSQTLRTFRESCKKDYLHQIDRRDILDYVDFLRAQGSGRRTIANRVSYVLTFMRKQGFKDIIHPSDLPKYTEKIVKAYSSDQLRRLFDQADTEDKVLFHFFLGSGCRDNEVVHACWEDVDFNAKTYDVREKPHMKFFPKDHEERTIPLPTALMDMLREHRMRHPKARLLFPGETGGPNHHLLRRLKGLALDAGLNCGRCISGKKNLSCAEHPVCGEWELHRFRKTFATMHANAGVKIHDISRWCGHASIETTMAYLAASEMSSADVREQVEQTFSAFAVV